MKILAIFVFLFTCLHAEKFLLLTNQMPSHTMMVWSFGDALGEKGHDVVALTKTTFDRRKLKHFEKNIKVWEYAPDQSELQRTANLVNSIMEEALDRALKGLPPQMRPDMIQYLYNETLAIVENEELMKRIKDYKFDAAIIDSFILARFFAIIPHHFDIPIISVMDTLMDPVIQPIAFPSFSPSLLSLSTEKMSFIERLQNFIMYSMIKSSLLRGKIIPQAHDYISMLKRLRKSDKIQHWDDIVAEADLFVVTRNYMLEFASPEWPNTISIHSATVRPGKPLTQEFEQIVSANADKKIVYVSFGSLGDMIPFDLSRRLLNVFGKMKDVFFIWSYKLPKNVDVTVPSNIKIVSWAPQNDLLSDERVSAFITHGGNNGQAESVYHGTPMLCIPLFAEQPHNGRRIEYHNYGKTLPISELTEENLESKLREILDNKIYKETVTRASKIIKSEPISDMERVTSKMVTIARYGGAHLKSEGQNLSLFTYFSLDVIFFLLFVLFAILSVLFAATYFVILKLKDYLYIMKKQKDL